MALAQDTYTHDELLETARFVRGHRDKEWITRSLAGRGVKGTNESVLTSTHESDGKHWVVPTIRRDRKGVVRHLDREGEDPFDIAMVKEDGISFDTAEEAESFSRRYSALLGALHPRSVEKRSVEKPAWEKDVDVGDMPEGWLPRDKQGKAIMENQAKRMRELKDKGAPANALAAQRRRTEGMRQSMFEESGGLEEPKDLPSERDVGSATAAIRAAKENEPVDAFKPGTWLPRWMTGEEQVAWLRGEDPVWSPQGLKEVLDWFRGGREMGTVAGSRWDREERAERMALMDELFSAWADYAEEVDFKKREAMRPLPEDVEGSSNQERRLRGWLEEEVREKEKYIAGWFKENFEGTLSPFEAKHRIGQDQALRVEARAAVAYVEKLTARLNEMGAGDRYGREMIAYWERQIIRSTPKSDLEEMTTDELGNSRVLGFALPFGMDNVFGVLFNPKYMSHMDLVIAAEAFEAGTATAKQMAGLEALVDWQFRQSAPGGQPTAARIMGEMPAYGFEFWIAGGLIRSLGRLGIRTASQKAVERTLTRLGTMKMTEVAFQRNLSLLRQRATRKSFLRPGGGPPIEPLKASTLGREGGRRWSGGKWIDDAPVEGVVPELRASEVIGGRLARFGDNAELALGVGVEQMVAQTLLGELGGMSRLRTAVGAEYLSRYFDIGQDEALRLQVKIVEDQSLLEVLPSALLRYGAEIFSEGMGPALRELGPAMNTLAIRKLSAKLGGYSRAARFLETTGFHGVPEELGEEFLNGLLLTGAGAVSPETFVGMEGSLDWATDLEEIFQMAGAFAVFGGTAHIASAGAAKAGEMLDKPGVQRGMAETEAQVGERLRTREVVRGLQVEGQLPDVAPSETEGVTLEDVEEEALEAVRTGDIPMSGVAVARPEAGTELYGVIAMFRDLGIDVIPVSGMGSYLDAPEGRVWAPIKAQFVRPGVIAVNADVRRPEPGEDQTAAPVSAVFAGGVGEDPALTLMGVLTHERVHDILMRTSKEYRVRWLEAMEAADPLSFAQRLTRVNADRAARDPNLAPLSNDPETFGPDEAAAMLAESLVPYLQFVLEEGGSTDALVAMLDGTDRSSMQRLLDWLISMANKIKGVKIDTSSLRKLRRIVSGRVGGTYARSLTQEGVQREGRLAVLVAEAFRDAPRRAQAEEGRVELPEDPDAGIDEGALLSEEDVAWLRSEGEEYGDVVAKNVEDAPWRLSWSDTVPLTEAHLQDARYYGELAPFVGETGELGVGGRIYRLPGRDRYIVVRDRLSSGGVRLAGIFPLSRFTEVGEEPAGVGGATYVWNVVGVQEALPVEVEEEDADRAEERRLSRLTPLELVGLPSDYFGVEAEAPAAEVAPTVEAEAPAAEPAAEEEEEPWSSEEYRQLGLPPVEGSFRGKGIEEDEWGMPEQEEVVLREWGESFERLLRVWGEYHGGLGTGGGYQPSWEDRRALQDALIEFSEAWVDAPGLETSRMATEYSAYGHEWVRTLGVDAKKRGVWPEGIEEEPFYREVREAVAGTYVKRVEDGYYEALRREEAEIAARGFEEPVTGQFGSGLQRGPRDIEAEIDAGRDPGVALADPLSKRVWELLVNHVHGGVGVEDARVFLDSGAFIAFKRKLKAKKDRRGEKPLDWDRVLDNYFGMLSQVDPDVRRGVMVVAPDVVGSHEESMDLLGTLEGREGLDWGEERETLGRRMEQLLDWGATVIFPVQMDARKEGGGTLQGNIGDLTDMMPDYTWERPGVRIGVPFNEKSWGEEAVLEYLRGQKAMKAVPMPLHLFGGGPTKVASLVEAAKREDLSLSSVTADAMAKTVRQRAYGKTGGAGARQAAARKRLKELAAEGKYDGDLKGSADALEEKVRQVEERMVLDPEGEAEGDVEALMLSEDVIERSMEDPLGTAEERERAQERARAKAEEEERERAEEEEREKAEEEYWRLRREEDILRRGGEEADALIARRRLEEHERLAALEPGTEEYERALKLAEDRLRDDRQSEVNAMKRVAAKMKGQRLIDELTSRKKAGTMEYERRPARVEDMQKLLTEALMEEEAAKGVGDTVVVWSRGDRADRWVVEGSHRLRYAVTQLGQSMLEGMDVRLEEGRRHRWWRPGVDANWEEKDTAESMKGEMKAEAEARHVKMYGMTKAEWQEKSKRESRAREEQWVAEEERLRLGREKRKARKEAREKGDRDQGTLFSLGGEIPNFYSALERGIAGLEQERFSVAQLGGVIEERVKGKRVSRITGVLRKLPGVRAEELRWVDWDGLMEGRKSVTKAEVLEWLAGHRIEVREVISVSREEGGDVRHEATQVAGPRERYREVRMIWEPPAGVALTSWGHFPEDNILAVLRFSERTDASGRRVVFLDEGQSDWHQKGAKEGYGAVEYTKEDLVLWEVGRDKPLALYRFRVRGEAQEVVDVLAASKEEAESKALDELREKGAFKGLPEAPFAKSWPDLVMKRLVMWAADNGFDGVAWSTGEIMRARWTKPSAGKLLDDVYEERFRQAASKLGKKFGQKVGTTQLWGEAGDTTRVHLLPVSEEMREDVRENGLSLFSLSHGRPLPSPGSRDYSPTLFRRFFEYWLGNLDWIGTRAGVWAGANKRRLLATMPEGDRQNEREIRRLELAMHLYIDMAQAELEGDGTPEEQYEKYVRGPSVSGSQLLTGWKRTAVERAMNLTSKQEKLAMRIAKENRMIGQYAVENGVLQAGAMDFDDPFAPEEGGLKRWYSMRLWVFKDEGGPGLATSARGRQKRRKFKSTLQGWSLGYELEVDSIIEAQRVMTMHIMEAVANRVMYKGLVEEGLILEKGKKRKDKTGKLVEVPAPEGWIEVPLRGVNAYAPPSMAKELEKVLNMRSDLMKYRFFRALARFSGFVKRVRLGMSLFHHQAFMRSSIYTMPLSDVAKNIPGLAGLGLASAASPWAPEWADRMAKGEIPFLSWLGSSAYKLGAEGVESVMELSPAYRGGAESASLLAEELQELVELGVLTFGRQQEYEAIRRMTYKEQEERALKAGHGAAAAAWFAKVLENATGFLFERMGTNLKVAAAVLDLREEKDRFAGELESGVMEVATEGGRWWLERHGNRETPDFGTSAEAIRWYERDIVRIVSEKANDDFGGLNLRRGTGLIGGPRNPTAQHILRMLLLAPDWTESNMNTAIKAFKSGNEGRVYRRMWRRIVTRFMSAQVLWNFLFAAGGDPEEYLKLVDEAIKAGTGSRAKGWTHLRWMDLDVTRFAQWADKAGYMDIDEGSRKYLSSAGHFGDVPKWLVSVFGGPKKMARVASHKLSPVAKPVLDLFKASDYAERPYTSWSELIGTDYKGVYKQTRLGQYEFGEAKGGRLAGQTVSWGSWKRGSGWMLDFDQIPSYVLNQVMNMTPIQIQAWFDWSMGTQDTFDTLGEFGGFATSRTWANRATRSGD